MNVQKRSLSCTYAYHILDTQEKTRLEYKFSDELLWRIFENLQKKILFHRYHMNQIYGINKYLVKKMCKVTQEEEHMISPTLVWKTRDL